jgi:hypothetical protein
MVAPNIQMEEKWLNRDIFFRFFSATLNTGFIKQLSFADLPQLSNDMKSGYRQNVLQNIMKLSNQSSQNVRQNSILKKSKTDWITSGNLDKLKEKAFRTYVSVAFRAYYPTFISLGILKLLIALSAFSGPLMLGKMVSYVEDDGKKDLKYGILLVLLLGLSFIISSVLNTMFNLRANLLYIKLSGGLTLSVFERAMSLPIYAGNDLQLTNAMITNIIQNDVDSAANMMRNVNDLWSLPLQIIVAFVLLYIHVKMAFMASVFMILVLIPVNYQIAKRIGVATSDFLTHRDARVQVISDALKNMRRYVIISCSHHSL